MRDRFNAGCVKEDQGVAFYIELKEPVDPDDAAKPPVGRLASFKNASQRRGSPKFRHDYKITFITAGSEGLCFVKERMSGHEDFTK